MRSFTRLAYGNCFLDLGNAKAGCRSLVVVTNNVFLHAHNLDWDNLGGLGRWSTCFIRRNWELCREGRLFEVEARLRAGKPATLLLPVALVRSKNTYAPVMRDFGEFV